MDANQSFQSVIPQPLSCGGSWPGNRSGTTGDQTVKSRGDSSPSCFHESKDQAQPGERLTGERITGEGGWS